jgi:hypothetical protein
MEIVKRRYRLLSDFSQVHGFLADIYTLDTLNSYLLPPFFEYAHTHPFFNHKLTHRFGVWEEKGKIIGIACYEMDIGESFLVTDKEHTFLLPEMLDHAEEELSVLKNGKHTLSVWVTDKETVKIDLLTRRGYKKVHSEPIRIFSYDKPFPDVKLPEGFTAISLLKLSNKKYNQTLIVITHDERIAMQADRIISIEDGRICKDEVICS